MRTSALFRTSRRGSTEGPRNARVYALPRSHSQTPRERSLGTTPVPLVLYVSVIGVPSPHTISQDEIPLSTPMPNSHLQLVTTMRAQSHRTDELCNVCGVPIEAGRETCGCEEDLPPAPAHAMGVSNRYVDLKREAGR